MGEGMREITAKVTAVSEASLCVTRTKRATQPKKFSGTPLPTPPPARGYLTKVNTDMHVVFRNAVDQRGSIVQHFRGIAHKLLVLKM